MSAHSILKQYFGYDSFRGGQEDLISNILAGKDALGIMPTGAGKSLCFQIPALMLNGVTLIISPLISLMKDQVNALTQSGIAAAFINSSLTEKQISLALQNARRGVYKLIYIAPERLLTEDFLSFIRSVEVSMITVDEAHCISQWGQDFRPSYSKIPEFVSNLKSRPIISAFTATATPKVRDDIVELLQLDNPFILVTGFDRPNLFFDVQKPKSKYSVLTAFLEDKKEKSGIIYCATRAAVDEVCDKLQKDGYNALRYHAGLSDRERHDNQDEFIYDRVQIIVATNAFGMGIDKSNVSYVIHYNMPKDIESYYQEAGRAGRDGEPADCILLYSGQDVRTSLWLIENARDYDREDMSLSLEKILERDRKRLREMTFYCATSDCLRGYMLKYFGEKPFLRCGNCGTCITEFEMADITVEAQKVLSCVVRMKERYGVNTLIDVLRGSKNEKTLRLGLNKLTTYGISKKSDKQLREIINHLILADYLVKTDDEFPLIKLGARADEILRSGAEIHMKLPKEKSTDPKQEKQSTARPIDRQLFDVLRDLRLAIAKEQNVPAFVVFPDSTLTDMCMKIPATPEEFLAVSGIGQAKARRYGGQFLKAISEFMQNKDESKTASMPESESSNSFDLSAVEITEEPITVSVIADRINCLLIQNGYEKISGRRINDWLVSNGYLCGISEKGENRKIPTNEGTKLGISTEERLIRGKKVNLNLFGRNAQEFIISNSLKILAEKYYQ